MAPTSKALQLLTRSRWVRYLHEQAWSGPLVVLVPTLLLCLCIVGLVHWPSTLAEDSTRRLPFRMAIGPERGWDPGTANAQLRNAPAVDEMSTQLATSPIYFLLDLRGLRDVRYVYMPVGYAVSLACWDSATGRSLGAADRFGRSDRILRIGSGFAVPLQVEDTQSPLRCEGVFQGPARVRFEPLTEVQLRGMSERHHRLMGALDGGSLMLMTVMLITAVITRTKVYAIFALWAAANWRLAEQVLGSGADLLTLRIPGDLVVPFGLSTVFLFMAANYLLFIALFERELERVQARRSVQALRAGVVLAAVLLIAAPMNVFAAAAWTISGLLIVVMVSLMVRMMKEDRKGLAGVYCLMLSLSLAASLYLVVSVALGIKSFSYLVFGVSNTLLSSLLATMTVASKLHAETTGRQQLSERLARSYDHSPVGLFTAGMAGKLVSCNRAFSDLSGLDERCDASSWTTLLGSEGWQRALSALSPFKDQAVVLDAQRGQQFFELRLRQVGHQVEGSLQDVTAVREAQAQQERHAHYDALTNTLSPPGMEIAAERLRQEAARTEEEVYLLSFDLERLGPINDLFGHETGDLVLAEVATRLSTALPERAILSRAGGDQFLAALIGNCDHARDAALRCVTAVTTRRIDVDGVSVSVDSHAGACPLRLSLSDAKAQAELACRTARKRKVKVVIDEDSSDNQAGSALVLARQTAERLRHMPGLRELRPGIIPWQVIEHPTRGPIAHEVAPTLRSNGQLLPQDILLLAADIWGRTDELDLWTVRTALNFIKATEPAARCRVAVTLSGATVANAEGARRIVQVIQDNIEYTHYLAVRIPQGAALVDASATRALAERLAGYSCSMVLCELTWGGMGQELIWADVWSGLELSDEIYQAAGSGGAAGTLLGAVAAAARERGVSVFASCIPQESSTAFVMPSGLHQLRLPGRIEEATAPRL